MKKIMFVLTMAVCIALISCSDKGGGMSDATKKNLDAMHGINKCFETKDFSKVGDYLAEDAVDHAGPTGDVKGMAGVKAAMDEMSKMTEGDKMTIIKELADDDYVMQWSKYTGKLKMAMGTKKAGDMIDGEAIEVVKFKDGKATEHWTMMTPQECMKMEAMMPAPMAKDSTTAKPAGK